MNTHNIEPTVFQYMFGPAEPAVRITGGDTIIAETRDAHGDDKYGDPIPESMKQRIPGTELCEVNPVVGPIYVENAEVEDLLAIHIQKIDLNRDYAFSKQGPHFGSLTGEGRGKTLLYNDPIPEIYYHWHLDLEKNVGILDMPSSTIGRAEIPLEPFIGSIGVAPRYGRIETTLAPGEFGGNMDFREVREGTTLYLPVWVKGAFLSFGDIHAQQGDGEVNGTAMEATAEVTLRIKVIKNIATPVEWPRLVDNTSIMVIGSARPLMDAIRVSQIELLNWLIGEYGFNREEAWQLMAQVGEIKVANIVDTAYTAVSKFPKVYLPG